MSGDGDGIEVDFSRPPFCIVRHPSVHRIEDFDGLFDRLRATMVPGERWAVLVDLRASGARMGGPEVREAASKSILKNVDFLREHTICEARVTSGPMVRGLLTVLDWITPRPWPIRNFGNGIVAEDWLRARLIEAGVEAPVARIWDELVRVSQ